MSKLKSPAFQWYPRDYIASTRVTMMSLVEEAIYRKLLDYCWLEGCISSSPERIMRLIGKESDLDSIREVLKMFTPNPDDESTLIHDRLEIERDKQAANSAKRSAAAKARWDKKADSDANALQMQSKCNANEMQTECLTTTITTTPTITTTTTNDKDTKASIAKQVEEIYQSYPKKVSKPQALKAITKALKTTPFDELLKLTKQFAKARQGQDKQFTPHPASWFNGERYHDDPDTWSPSQNQMNGDLPRIPMNADLPKVRMNADIY